MKKRNVWLTRVLAGSMVLGLLTTSAMATSVDMVVPVGEGFDAAQAFEYGDIAAVKDVGGTTYRYVTVENGKLVPAQVEEKAPSILLYAVQVGDKWGYNDKADGSGVMMIPAVYDAVAVDVMEDWFDLYVAKEAGVWGVYQRDTTNCGVTGIANASYAADELYSGVKVQGADGKWGLIDLQHWEGEAYLTLPMLYDDVMGTDNLNAPNATGRQYWVKNGANVSVVGNQRTDQGETLATFFTMGAQYYQALKDAEGNWQHPTRFQEDDQVVIRDTTVPHSKYGIIGMDGAMVADFLYDDISSIGMGMYAVRKFGETSSCAMMAHDGSLVTDFIFGALNQFNELGVTSGCLMGDYSAWGLISQTGDPITGYLYSDAHDCGEGLWQAKKANDGKGAVMTSDGKLLTDFIYEGMGRTYDGLLPVVRDGKFGLVNTMGDEALPCAYDALGKYSQGAEEDYKNPYDYGYYDCNWVGQMDATGGVKLGVIKNNYDITVEQQTTTLVINGVAKTVGAYATRDAAGNLTNYFKLRDVASLLNGSSAQFNVNWEGAVVVELNTPYAANGSEMSVPFSGTQVGNDKNANTRVGGQWTTLDTITLTDAAGSGYTYYKLRDLGSALGFNVGWDAATASISVTTP